MYKEENALILFCEISDREMNGKFLRIKSNGERDECESMDIFKFHNLIEIFISTFLIRRSVKTTKNTEGLEVTKTMPFKVRQNMKKVTE